MCKLWLGIYFTPKFIIDPHKYVTPVTFKSATTCLHLVALFSILLSINKYSISMLNFNNFSYALPYCLLNSEFQFVHYESCVGCMHFLWRSQNLDVGVFFRLWCKIYFFRLFKRELQLIIQRGPKLGLQFPHHTFHLNNHALDINYIKCKMSKC